MRNLAVIILTILFALNASGQPVNPSVKTPKKPATKKALAAEKAELEKALALTNAAEKIAALLKFIEDYPNSKELSLVLENITVARAALADEKFRVGEKAEGIELFKLALRDAPKPLSDKLFSEVVLQIPNSLFYRGEPAAAIEAANLVEEKADGNAKQMLALATFYLNLENGGEAKRLADRAVVLEPNLPAAYQTLGLASRLNFQLEESANAYAKALELDPTSAVAKRNLAEMKRATGKVAEAAALYREILAADAGDGVAQTGLILALFDDENRAEAESGMAKSLAANPNNIILLVGAAYWYAAHNEGAKAIELAERAVAAEPRYTWARVALARGLMQQKKPLDAEKALLAARQYGDFPTLDYELAAARLQAGFYREAAETLRGKFSVTDGVVRTKLGGRVSKESKSFIELLAAERRASIFQTLAADSPEAADKLEALLDFTQRVETGTDETASAAADEFLRGDDKMKIHRQLFAADQLLQKRKALPKVLELTKAAIKGVDAGLDMPSSTGAILADELYQSRRLAITRNELIIVPDVPRRTLSDIVRGRIEDISGWALFQENKSAEAVTRLKRAVSVLPEKSSWWRSAMWRLGTAQEATGNLKDALDAYVKSYADGEPDVIKYGIVEAAHQKLNGSTDGLEAKIGARPASATAALPIPMPMAIRTTEQTAAIQLMPEASPIAGPTPAVAETPPTVATASPLPEIPNTETSNAEKSGAPQTAPTPGTNAETPAETTLETKVEPSPKPLAETKTEPASEAKTEPASEQPKIEVKQTGMPAKQPTESVTKPLFEPVIINVPKVESLKKPTPESSPVETPVVKENLPVEETKTATPPIVNNPPETVEEKKSAVENVASRPRVVVEEDTKPQVIVEDNLKPEIAPCLLNVSQERVSILSDGGNASLLVGVEGENAPKEIKATSSSPADVAVVFEPEVKVTSGRAFFVVKSTSAAVGLFTVTFEAACGKKEVAVRVR